jgi:hypothetical protein
MGVMRVGMGSGVVIEEKGYRAIAFRDAWE